MKKSKLLGMAFIFFFASLFTSIPVSAGTRVVVKVAPPKPKKVVIVKKSPYKHGVWVSGHWTWKNGKYVWHDGHWVKAKPGFKWVQGHWKKTANGWVWIPGHWKKL